MHIGASTIKSSIARKTVDQYCPEYVVVLMINNSNEVGLAAFNEISGEIVISQVIHEFFLILLF